jgi:hypothetical protein
MFLTGSALLFGLLRGMAHALEPDHLAAVSTLVADSRGVSRAGLLLGAAWGAGHTFTLFVVGCVLFLFRTGMPPRIETLFELLVACMLIVLGIRALIRAVVEGRLGVARPHVHGVARHVHAHAGSDDHVHVRGFALARRPLVIGIVHGLAGGGALTAAVLAQLPTPLAGLLYMAVFGVGSSAGMALLSGIAGASLARLAERRKALPLLLGLSGVVSLCLGLAWGAIHARALLA